MIRRYSVAVFFALACAISWGLWAPLWLPWFGVSGLPILPFHHAFGALGPIGAALVTAALESGWAGARDLLRRLVLIRGRLVWLAVALFGPFALVALAVGAASLFGADGIPPAGLGRSEELPQSSLLGLLAYNVLTFGVGEEVGWRGFALPRLQTRHSALVASLLLTVGWALWHTPLFLYRAGFASMNAGGVAGWFFGLVTGAILLTWLYNESRGSLLVVALFHAAVDVAFTSAATSPFVVNATGALMTFCGIAVLVAAGPRYLSRRGKMIQVYEGESVTAFFGRRP